jgi:hypothetical protein
MQYAILLFSYHGKHFFLQRFHFIINVNFENLLQQSKECVYPGHTRISHSKNTSKHEWKSVKIVLHFW